MAVVNGSLARKLEFGEEAITVGTSKLRLAPAFRMLGGPDKYKVLEHRRRQAQINARRLLEIADEPAISGAAIPTDAADSRDGVALAASGSYDSQADARAK